MNLQKTHPETGKIAVIKYDASIPGAKERAEKELEHKIKTERERQLDPLKKKHESKCPYCVTDKEPEKRIDRAGVGGLFGGYVDKKEIFTCKPLKWRKTVLKDCSKRKTLNKN